MMGTLADCSVDLLQRKCCFPARHELGVFEKPQQDKQAEKANDGLFVIGDWPQLFILFANRRFNIVLISHLNLPTFPWPIQKI